MLEAIEALPYAPVGSAAESTSYDNDWSADGYTGPVGWASPNSSPVAI
jgi:hypothetical protein